MKLAPIVLFAFNRPQHTRRTLEALAKNHLAQQSDLVVFCDGVPAEVDKHAQQEIQQVQEIVQEKDWCRSVSLTIRENHLGLRENILKGVSEIVSHYGKVIVLEDDIETSPWFLDYMNRALEMYQHSSQVYHISGYSLPLNSSSMTETYFVRMPSCWGWGTWSRAWKNLDTNADALINRFTRSMIHEFNLGGAENFWNHLLENQTGKKRTWAIFWYASIFLRKGLCLHPGMSYTRNIGWDGTGVHCNYSESYLSQPVNSQPIKNFPAVIQEDLKVVRKIQDFYRRSHPAGWKKVVKRIWGRRE